MPEQKTAEGFLEGISMRTKKMDLLKRLKELAGLLEDRDKARISKLEEVEARIRAKRDEQSYDLRSVIVTASQEEFVETYEFLEEFGELLPVALARLNEGAKVVGEEIEYDETNDDV